MPTPRRASFDLVARASRPAPSCVAPRAASTASVPSLLLSPPLTRALLLMALCGACGAEPSATSPAPAAPREIIDGALWTPIPRAQDPFVTLLPGAVTACASSGVTVEDAMLEMDTGACGFISASTALTEPVAEGERVQITMWHLALYADPPATGQLRVHIGGAEVWRLDVAIPRLEQVYRPVFKASKAWPVGTKVEVHVHNHGGNTWKVYQITAGG